MPKGIYVRTEEVRNKLKQWCINNPELVKKRNEKRNKTMEIGYSSGKITPHNKGKTKENYLPLQIVSQKESETMKRKYANNELIPHCKGKTKDNYEPLRIVSEKLIGVPKSEEMKEKNRLTQKRIIREGKKKIWNKNKTAEEDSRILVGEKNPNFNNWSSREPYGEKWSSELRESTRKRDNHTCQECNYTQEQLGYTLPIHHIDYNKKNCNPSNLITLCRRCNAVANFSRGDWTKHFQEKINQMQNIQK